MVPTTKGSFNQGVFLTSRGSYNHGSLQTGVLTLRVLTFLVTLGTLVFPVTLVSTSTPVIFLYLSHLSHLN